MLELLFRLLALHLAAGVLFAGPFVGFGVARIDPHAARASWGFRLIILPGVILLWPLLAHRWWRGNRHPPEERTAHRLAARAGAAHDRTAS